MASLPCFTVEQVELLRRLKNSGITRQQLLHAFDSLTRLDAELGPIYAVPSIRNPGLTIAMMNGAYRDHAVEDSNGSSDTNGNAAPIDLCFNRNGKTSTPKRAHSVAFGEDLNGSVNAHDSNFETITNDELLTYLSTKPEDQLVEDIREFASKHSIRQHHIANAAGISQSYVSRFFRGDFFEMSESSRSRIYKWYLWCQKNPEAATNPLTYTNMLANTSRNNSVSEFNSSLLDEKANRRERFTFNASQVAILENEFMLDNYPSTERREQLAELCNRETKSLQGRKMCSDVIANWFSNKRKEIKKLALKEGIIIETSRGRRPLARNWSDSSDLSRKCVEVKPEDLNAVHPQKETLVKEEPHDSDTDKTEDDRQESLAFAVEVAAVNEAIKSLSGVPASHSPTNGAVFPENEAETESQG